VNKYEQLMVPACQLIVAGVLTLLTATAMFESVRGFISFAGSLTLVIFSILECRRALRR
jgi:hypothetical protein